MPAVRIIVCAALFGVLSVRMAAADIYYWVDENNVPTFSDSASHPGAKVILREKKPATYKANELSPEAVNRQIPPQLVSLAKDAARAHSLEPALLLAVMKVESNFNVRAVSPKGARGLMQLMPGTAKRYGVNNIHDAEQNVNGGARYLRDLLAMFDNNVSLALAAYNAGEQSVIRHGNKIPPYRETLLYVPKVMRHFTALRKLHQS